MGQLYYKTYEADDKDLEAKLPAIGDSADWVGRDAVVKSISRRWMGNGKWQVEIEAEAMDYVRPLVNACAQCGICADRMLGSYGNIWQGDQSR